MKILRRDNLTHAFFFDEINGTTLTDKSGGGRNATTIGSPTIIDSVSGRGINFNPSGGTQNATCTEVANINAALTIMFACTPGTGSLVSLTQGFGICSKRDGGNIYAVTNGYTYPAQLLPLFFTLTPVYTTEANIIFFEENKYVRGSVCVGAGNVVMYKNGEIHNSYSVTGSIPNNLNLIRIGSGYIGNAGTCMRGVLDYLLIWNTKLSAQEVAIMDRRLSLKRGMNI